MKTLKLMTLVLAICLPAEAYGGGFSVELDFSTQASNTPVRQNVQTSRMDRTQAALAQPTIAAAFIPTPKPQQVQAQSQVQAIAPKIEQKPTIPSPTSRPAAEPEKEFENLNVLLSQDDTPEETNWDEFMGDGKLMNDKELWATFEVEEPMENLYALQDDGSDIYGNIAEEESLDTVLDSLASHWADEEAAEQKLAKEESLEEE